MAIIVGTGPSASAQPLDIAKGKARVIVIKSTWKLAPWVDALYGIDRGWWLANGGAYGFHGLKFSPSPTVVNTFPGIRQIKLKNGERVLLEPVGTVACGSRIGGGHSGFQAMNLAIQFGARRLLLVGFDMTLENGAHWNGEEDGVSKPDAARVKSWRETLDAAAAHFIQIGVEVLNCTPASALKAYPKVSLGNAV